MSRITIVILGEIHRDPAPPKLLMEHMDLIRSAKIPMVYCYESPHDNKLEEEIERHQSSIAGNAHVLKIPAIRTLLKEHKESGVQYFEIADLPKIEKILASIRPDLEDHVIHVTGASAISNNSHKSRLDLLKKIKHDGVAYFAIDCNKRETQAVQNNLELWQPNETYRMMQMTDQLFDTVIPRLKDNGGVIFISIGMLHVHRLTAHIMTKLATGCCATHTIIVQPTIMFSPLVEDAREAMLKAQHEYDNIDPNEIRSWYPCISITKLKAQITSGEKVNSTEFSTHIQRVIDTHTVKPVTISIPNLNANKKRVLALLGARVIEEKKELSKVEVLPPWLLKSARKKLEIDKHKIRFPDHTLHRLDYLKSINGVCIEATDENNVYHITFCQRDFARVKQAVIKWEDFSTKYLKTTVSATVNNLSHQEKLTKQPEAEQAPKTSITEPIIKPSSSI